ncbi:MAG: esterase [Hyphomicrobiales bacterium]|nr:MAG: esterase [Hyphomicrobiales bacterium]
MRIDGPHRARGAKLLPILLCLLTGCGSRNESVLQPLATAPPDTGRVDMLVATTRKAVDDPALRYSGDRAMTISLDRIVVSIPPDRARKIGDVQWPARAPADPEKEFAVVETSKLTSEKQTGDWFRKNRNRKRQALIFVHGFNNTYSDAVFRFAQIVHDARTDAAPILFSWPSRASALGYLYDKESTNYSRRALEDLILQAAESPDVGDITILAHSMGTWLTAEALRGVAMRNKRIPAKVSTVILASPDIDADVFRRQMLEMGTGRPHFVILSSTRDKALDLSRWLSGGIDRVGGLDLSPYAADLEHLGVSIIDTSTISGGDPLGHTTFAESPEIVRLLGRRIAGQSMEGDRGSLAERSGDVVVGVTRLAGRAVRTVGSAATAVGDPAIHEMLKRQRARPTSRATDGANSY